MFAVKVLSLSVLVCAAAIMAWMWQNRKIQKLSPVKAQRPNPQKPPAAQAVRLRQDPQTGVYYPDQTR